MSINSFIKRGLKYIVSGVPTKRITQEIVMLSPSNLLLGKTALITGGTSGIGFSIAESFINAGAVVCITGRDIKRCEKAVEQLKVKTGNRNNDKIFCCEMDMLQVSSFEQVVSSVVQKMGKIDILVNNAGINLNGSYHCTEEAYDSILDTNLKGMFFLSRCVGEYMVKNEIEGNILNIASASSLRPAINPYILSKWGVRGLTLGLAKKFIKYNIVVNGIAPGPTATPMLGEDSSDDIALPNNPSGRFALPEEIANMAVVLTSSMGRLVVGDIVYMTGGSGLTTFDDIKY